MNDDQKMGMIVSATTMLVISLVSATFLAAGKIEYWQFLLWGAPAVFALLAVSKTISKED